MIVNGCNIKFKLNVIQSDVRPGCIFCDDGGLVNYCVLSTIPFRERFAQFLQLHGGTCFFAGNKLSECFDSICFVWHAAGAYFNIVLVTDLV